MQPVILENDDLKVTVKQAGAEMTSLIDKHTGKELLWQGDASYWNRQSPILFPNVGKQYNMRYLYNGKEYPTNQHGFARDSIFSLLNQKDNAVSMVLEDNDKTREIFPFSFELVVSYRLNGKILEIGWEVINKDENTMYFTIGGHPGFNTLPHKEGYSLYFPDKSSIIYKLLNTQNGCVTSWQYELFLEDGKLKLNDEMFENDALIFDNSQISDVVLEHNDGTKILALHSPNFPNYGIWSKPDAPFICLEPWVGRADDDEFLGEISEKAGVINLKSGETFSKSYSIEVF